MARVGHRTEKYLKLKRTVWQVLPFGEINSCANGYFLHGNLLFRKWVPQGEVLVEELVFYFIVPSTFLGLVLQTCHGNIAGHPDVKKRYDRVLRDCFWPHLERDIAACIKYIKTCLVC